MEQYFIYDGKIVGRSTPIARTEAYLKTYTRWAQDMVFNQKYNYSMKKLAAKLHVSSSWLRNHLMPALNYIKLDTFILDSLGMDNHSTLLFSEEEIKKYLVAIAVFTRQTIVVDVNKIAGKKILYTIDNDPSIKHFDEQNINTFGKRASVVLDMLGDDYDNVNIHKRSEYPEIKIEPFDFWSYPWKFSSDYPNSERAYRDFFTHGYIKICIFGKSIFVLKENLNKVTYPLTIPYKGKK